MCRAPGVAGGTVCGDECPQWEVTGAQVASWVLVTLGWAEAMSAGQGLEVKGQREGQEEVGGRLIPSLCSLCMEPSQDPLCDPAWSGSEGLQARGTGHALTSGVFCRGS